MNKYRLPANAYNRTYDKTIREGDIKKALVGQKSKEIIDVIVDEDKMLCGAKMNNNEEEDG